MTHITEAEEPQTHSGYSGGCTLHGEGRVIGGVLEGLSRHPFFLPPYPLHSTVGSLIPCVRPLLTNCLAILPFCLAGASWLQLHDGIFVYWKSICRRDKCVGTRLCHYVRLVFLANRFSLTLIVGKIDIGVGSKRTGNEGMHGTSKFNLL